MNLTRIDLSNRQINSDERKDNTAQQPVLMQHALTGDNNNTSKDL